MLMLLIQIDELLLKWNAKGIAPLHITIELFDEKVRQLRNEVEAQVQLGMVEGETAMPDGKRCEESDTRNQNRSQAYHR